jgi:hypothetical protein
MPSHTTRATLSAPQIPSERKTGAQPVARTMSVRNGGLDVLRRVA